MQKKHHEGANKIESQYKQLIFLVIVEINMLHAICPLCRVVREGANA